MSYKAEMLVQGQWSSNSCRFETETEAKAAALNLFHRWTIPDDWRVAPSDDPVNYRADDDGNATPIDATSTASAIHVH